MCKVHVFHAELKIYQNLYVNVFVCMRVFACTCIVTAYMCMHTMHHIDTIITIHFARAVSSGIQERPSRGTELLPASATNSYFEIITLPVQHLLNAQFCTDGSTLMRTKNSSKEKIWKQFLRLVLLIRQEDIPLEAKYK